MTCAGDVGIHGAIMPHIPSAEFHVGRINNINTNTHGNNRHTKLHIIRPMYTPFSLLPTAVT
jgi:hypothetical protein